VYDSIPQEGDANVPTNVIPWVYISGELLLEDSEGNVVPTTERSSYNPDAGCSRYSELVPEQELEPDTEYRIKVRSEDFEGNEQEAVLNFTTASGPADAAGPAAPSLAVAFFDGEAFLSSCVYERYRGCIVGEHQGLVDVTVKRGNDELRHHVTTLARSRQLFLESEEGEHCVEVRARDITGQLSEPRTFCTTTGDLPALAEDPEHWEPDCDSAEILSLLESDPNEIPEVTLVEPEPDPESAPDPVQPNNLTDPDPGMRASGGGCSLSSGSASGVNAGASAFALALFGLVGLCRRRRAKR
jgi:hypothetical protein